MAEYSYILINFQPRGTSVSRPRRKVSYFRPEARPWAPSPDEVAAWDALTEDNKAGYLAALDLLIEHAEASGRDPEEFHVEFAGNHLRCYYEKFILGRHETPQDDWYSLPRYRNWRVSGHYGWRTDLPSIRVGAHGKLGKSANEVLVVPNCPMSRPALEVLQVLAREDESGSTLDELIRRAVLLA